MASTRTPTHNAGDVQLNVWLPRDLRDDLHRIAAAEDLKAAQIVRSLVRGYVNDHDTRAAAA